MKKFSSIGITLIIIAVLLPTGINGLSTFTDTSQISRFSLGKSRMELEIDESPINLTNSLCFSITNGSDMYLLIEIPQSTLSNLTRNITITIGTTVNLTGMHQYLTVGGVIVGNTTATIPTPSINFALTGVPNTAFDIEMEFENVPVNTTICVNVIILETNTHENLNSLIIIIPILIVVAIAVMFLKSREEKR